MDPCAKVTGLKAPYTPVHHRVLGRLRPKHHYTGAKVTTAVHHDPARPTECSKTFFPKKSFVAKAAYLPATFVVAAITGGPTAPPYQAVSSPPPITPTVPGNGTSVPSQPGHPVQVSEPASIFVLMAGLFVLFMVRRHLVPSRHHGMHA
jgi:hypothetical protein